MRLSFLSLIPLFFVLAGCGSDDTKVAPPEKPKVEAPPPRTVRVLVAPFQDLNAHDQTAYVSMGLAVFATARFEELSRSLDPAKGLKLEAVVGPHAYPAEAARLRPDRRAPIDAPAAFAEARRVGATHVLTGSYGGHVEKWSLTVELYEVGPDALISFNTSGETRNIYANERQEPKHPGHQMPVIHQMFSAQTAIVFAKGGIVLPPEALTALSTPQSAPAMAFIRLSEAYRALLLGEGEEAMKVALEKSENAILIWPDYQIGLRLYAWLLWQRGKTVAARKQFAEALARDPEDVRALIALGRVEIAEGQYDAGRAALSAAVQLRPDDAVIHFWLGEAHAKLGDIAEAIARYERSRELDTKNLDTHRALAGLYAGERRYAEAAKELAIVVDGEPENLDAVFLLAACLRAAGSPDAAIAVYVAASARFPKVPRLHKFRGDLLKEARRDSEADAAYAEAKKLMPKDARWNSEKGILWGARLVAEIRGVEAVRVEMERLRSEFQLAVSDGIWDLAWNKKEACAPGRAGSSFLLARETGRIYDARGAEMQSVVEALRVSLKNGEGAALTPDEHTLAEGIIRYEGIALQDLREMRTGYAELKPLLSTHGCSLDPSEISVASIDAIRQRNAKRFVTMPEPKARDMSGISPVVPTDARRVVKFTVDNKGKREYVLVLDGKPLEPSIEPGKRQTYATTIGEHAFCLLPKERAEDCGKPGTPKRSTDFHEGWNAIIQQDL